MLLRNLCPPKLCNGTHLRITAIRKNVIEATIITGNENGESILNPHVLMIPSDYPFQVKCMQFTAKVSFTMTINQSHDQSFKFERLGLRESCFSHDQSYALR